MSDRLQDDLVLIKEHLESIKSYFEEIKTKDNFSETKQGSAYYDAILMHLQVAAELIKKNYKLHKNVFEKDNAVDWKLII